MRRLIGNLTGSMTVCRIASLLLVLATCLPLTWLSGCQAPASTEETAPTSGDHKPLIGFAMDTLVIERWESDRNIFVSTVNELGGEVIVQNANSDAEEQENQIRYLIKKNVDVLVIVAIDETKLADEMQLAEERRIDVIAYDRMIHHQALDLYISFDSTSVGRLMAEAIAKDQSTGRLVIMNGSEADHNSTLIREGIRDVLKYYPGLEVVAESSATNWSADDAYIKFKQILGSQEGITGILCSNDALAGAAVRALGLYRLSGQVAVTGQDADLDACQRIVEGTQLMTVYKPIATLAKSAAEAAVALAQGNVPTASDTINADGRLVPYERIIPIAVDAGNILDAIISSGFHTLKDVYRNIPQDQWPDRVALDH